MPIPRGPCLRPDREFQGRKWDVEAGVRRSIRSARWLNDGTAHWPRLARVHRRNEHGALLERRMGTAHDDVSREHVTDSLLQRSNIHALRFDSSNSGRWDSSLLVFLSSSLSVVAARSFEASSHCLRPDWSSARRPSATICMSNSRLDIGSSNGPRRE